MLVRLEYIDWKTFKGAITMKRRTEIDLTRMSEDGRMYYLQDLLQDCVDVVMDLTDNKVRYDYVQATLEHASQAVLDLEKLIKEGK